MPRMLIFVVLFGLVGAIPLGSRGEDAPAGAKDGPQTLPNVRPPGLDWGMSNADPDQRQRMLRFSTFVNGEVPDKYMKAENTVGYTVRAIAAGGPLYATHCRQCHGTLGLGNGDLAYALKPSRRYWLIWWTSRSPWISTSCGAFLRVASPLGQPSAVQGSALAGTDLPDRGLFACRLSRPGGRASPEDGPGAAGLTTSPAMSTRNHRMSGALELPRSGLEGEAARACSTAWRRTATKISPQSRADRELISVSHVARERR